MKKILPFTIVLLFFMGLVLVPPVGELDFIQDIREESTPILSEDVVKNIRVAIYNEANTSAVTYCANPFGSNALQPTIDLLTGAGYDVTLLSTGDILNHELLTANYDVFVLVDNVPRESIYDYVYEFWLGGGGILSFNGGFGFLQFSGIFSPDWAGGDRFGGDWLYLYMMFPPTENYTILSRHSTAQDYHIGDNIATYLNDTVMWNPTYSGVSNAAEITPIAGFAADPTIGCMVAVDPINRAGGRAVQLAGNGSFIEPGLESIIIDSVDWLAPRPRARIVFDISHQPRLGMDPWDTMTEHPGEFEIMRDMYEMEGYTIDKLYGMASGNLTLSRLAPYDMLILVSPDYNYTNTEINAVQNWVAAGGGLLVLGESLLSGPFLEASEQINFLMDGLDLQLANTTSVTSTGLVIDHPLRDGCLGVSFFANGFVNYTGNGFGIAYEDSNAIVGGSHIGAGRVILVADMNFAWDANIGDGTNELFVSNMANWLSSAEARILYFTNDGYYNRGTSPCALALHDLGIAYSASYWDHTFNLSLSLYSWDLVIVDAGWANINWMLDDINSYLDTGGKLIMSYYDADSVSHPMWSRIGFEVAASPPVVSLPPTYIWQSGHGIFNMPNDYTAANFTPGIAYGDEGDLLTVFSNATALAGFYESPAAGNASIVLGLDGRVLYNALLTNEYVDDLDDSTYTDHYELWENEIAFMLRPTINHPSDVDYVEESTGNSIGWTPSSDRPWRYTIEQDSVQIDSGPWNGGSIIIDIDGLNNGTYDYEVSAYDTAGYFASDTVSVNVTPASSTTNTTGGGGSGDLTTLLIIIAAGGVVIIIVIVVLMKKKK
ncbi:MAG: DUF4350 domain-containing protein [Candidatus Thorarchaeota archaeon]